MVHPAFGFLFLDGVECVVWCIGVVLEVLEVWLYTIFVDICECFMERVGLLHDVACLLGEGCLEGILVSFGQEV